MFNHSKKRVSARRRQCLIFGCLLTLALTGCATARVDRSTAIPEPRSGTVRPFDSRRPVVALVLSGGSARGFAHIGVIRVLEQMGIEPDLIVGTSAGSIVGAGYAAGLSADQLQAAAARFDASILMDFTLPHLGQPIIRGDLGLVRGERLQQFVEELVSRRPIEVLPRRLALVATDMQTGKPTSFTHGNVGLAVRASSSVPGLLVPSQIAGKLYIDGQVSSPLPVAAARSLGADIVIAVDATYPSQHANISSLPDVMFQSFMIACQRIKESELLSADLVIQPKIETTGQLGFKDRDWLITAGESATQEVSGDLRRLTTRSKP